MTPGRLVVFDLDGTLIDSSQDLANAVNAALAEVAPGTRPLPIARVRSFIGDGAGMLITRSLAEVGLSLPLESVLPTFLDRYRERLLEATRLYPGVEDALDHLQDWTLAVLSNKPGDMSRAILAGLGVAGRFAKIYGGGDVPGKKPDPVGLLRLMDETEARPDQTVVVGDSAVDIRMGRAGGVRTVGVTYGFDPAGVAQEHPDIFIDDLRDLPARLQSLTGCQT